MNDEKPTGINRLIKATGYSINGLKVAWQNEEAFRLEVIFTILLAPVGLWLGNTPTEKALLVGSLLLVIIVELANTAVENVVDRFGEEWHTLSGHAKDTASAAVMIALINSTVVWLIILFQYCPLTNTIY
jgi:diacylglycerol kinase (ATP)